MEAELDGTWTGPGPENQKTAESGESGATQSTGSVPASSAPCGTRHFKLNVSMAARATYLLLLLGILSCTVSPSRVKHTGRPYALLLFFLFAPCERQSPVRRFQQRLLQLYSLMVPELDPCHSAAFKVLHVRNPCYI